MRYLGRIHNNKDGFTLIELLVVIAIIGLLASIVLASLNTARAKARDTRRIEDIAQVKTSLELYFNDNGNYPSITGSNCLTNGWSQLKSALVPKYIASLPSDPLSGSYQYCSNMASNSQEYAIYAQMELSSSVPASSFKGDFLTSWGGDDITTCSLSNGYCVAVCSVDALDQYSCNGRFSPMPPNRGTYWPTCL